jgi:hypothetical protein
MKKFFAGALFGVLLSGSAISFASYGNPFSDIASDAWYTSAASDLYTRGVLTGYSDGTLRPDSNINRAETAVMMDRMLEDIDRNYEPFPEGQEDGNGPNYYICQATDGQVDLASQERIYEKVDLDTTIHFYDNTGTYLDQRAPQSQDPVVQTEDCILTTKEYFDGKVTE